MAGIEFSVPGCGRFLYDGCTNRLLTVDEDAVIPEELLSAEMENVVWRESLETLKRKQERELGSMVLQITRDCNLRCSYCAYSGSFNNMLPHEKIDMSPETLRASIDFFMEHSVDSPQIVIIFYGGEPLLQFEHIRMAVDYADAFKRNVRYGISSNGFMLGRGVLEWLNSHQNVYITVTVNGEKHDDYRRTCGGKGSLQTILSKLHYARENYPRVWEEQIRLIANVVSTQELSGLRDFYRRSIGKLPIMVTRVDFTGCEEAVSDQFRVDMQQERIHGRQMREEFISAGDPFLQTVFSEELDHIHNRSLVPEYYPGIIGSCMPLDWRLFVRTDGTFNMCEKVCDYLNLGSLSTGFDEERIEQLYSDLYHFANRNCRGCWAQRLCMYCYQDIVAEGGRVLDSFSSERCTSVRESILEALKMYVRVSRKCPERLKTAEIRQ